MRSVRVCRFCGILIVQASIGGRWRELSAIGSNCPGRASGHAPKYSKLDDAERKLIEELQG